MMYCEDSSDALISMQTKVSTDWRIGQTTTTGTWNPLALGAPPGLTGFDLVKWQTEEGYKEGKLFQYAPNPGVVHCPGDLRWTANINAYDSYSGLAGLNGEVLSKTPNMTLMKKRSQIQHPSDRFAWAEEMDSRGDNINSWDFNIGPKPSYTGSTWVDSPACYHINSTTFAFCDGHAESHKWIVGDTIAMAKSTDTSTSDGVKFYHNPVPADNADVMYVALRFPCPENP
jgi:prepilin-type processing-associated H-X9-DG protein